MWKTNKSLLIYSNASFKFSSKLILVDIEDLIDLRNINEYSPVKILYEEFIKQLQIESKTASIIILGYQSKSKSRILKMCAYISKFLTTSKLDCTVFISMERNFYTKPYTGIFQIVLFYYLKNDKKFDKVAMISHCNYSADYALIKNCEAIKEIKLYPLKEFVQKAAPKIYAPNVLRPEERLDYIEKHNKNHKPGWKDEILKIAADNYFILIIGPPRSGKTRICNEIIEWWKTTKLNENFTIKYGYGKQELRQLIKNKFCIITETTDFDYDMDEFKAHKIIIDIQMDKKLVDLLNHVAVIGTEAELISTERFAVYEFFKKPIAKKEGTTVINLYPYIRLDDKIKNYYFD